MKSSILFELAMVVLGTALFLYSVIEHEPPAFFAYVFGILTGACWTGILGLYWLRHADEDEGDKHD
ncbi:MAG: hypothetical protein IKE46_01000 [Selenomonadaceae bacterium]|nr:hypothetical protein [Selenomonadaceae bacterium]